MRDIEIDHFDEGHDSFVAGCQVCERDALIDYQRSMIHMVEADYLDLVNHVDRVLKGIRAFNVVTQDQGSIIPAELSKLWVRIGDGHLPLEVEEVWLMVQVSINGDVENARTRGYYHKGKWYSQDTKKEIKDNVIAWRKIRGQLSQDEPDEKPDGDTNSIGPWTHPWKA